jgi:hypothetical protein
MILNLAIKPYIPHIEDTVRGEFPGLICRLVGV